MPAAKQKRILLLYGGWRGHSPKRFADFALTKLLTEYDVTCSESLRALRRPYLDGFECLLPIWTFGKLSDKQQNALLEAVAGGLGYVGWHGNASSFLECRPHKFMLGGQFVGHPGGNHIKYPVRFLNNDPLVKGLKDVTVRSEQYYLLVDPAVKVLADSPVHGGEQRWLKGVTMPVAWKKKWGRGRVFYCALGHTVNVLETPPVTTLLKRALAWACRNSSQKF